MAMNRAERRRQIKDDEQKLRSGIDADSSDPAGTAAMTRLMSDLLETAKRDRNIEPPVRFLHAKVDATLHAMRDASRRLQKGMRPLLPCVGERDDSRGALHRQVAAPEERASRSPSGSAPRIASPAPMISPRASSLHQQCPLLDGRSLLRLRDEAGVLPVLGLDQCRRLLAGLPPVERRERCRHR